MTPGCNNSRSSVQDALERALADLTLGSELVADDALVAGAWFARHGISKEDTEYLRRGGLSRLLIYRRLVRANLRLAIESNLPRAMARLGNVFDEYLDRFLAERGPRTHYLRDVTHEFLAFAAPLWASDPRVPSYVSELAHHEAVQLEIAAMHALPKDHAPAELALDARVDFIAACRIVFYSHAVHELSDDGGERTPPRAEATHLFVYRSPDHEVRFLKLTPMAAAILLRLLELEESLGEAVLNACRQHGVAVDECLLSGTARLLADLAERGALAGSRGSG